MFGRTSRPLAALTQRSSLLRHRPADPHRDRAGRLRDRDGRRV